eukprot:GFYU01012384.1.p1 GENE.GFYU01012384.1~~GFYU01012384.1.p1  ORF type:complete len:427 (-),score=160.63 GFYU01012384.1:282-1562(-)
MAPVRVGLLGAGTVGGGVISIFNEHKERFSKIGVEVNFTKICVRDLNKKRDFEFPAGAKVVTDPAEVYTDPEVDLVVEVMGGVTVAKDAVFGAIAAGKNVVTANKALVAKHLNEINELLAKHPNVKFGLEAAVCGGIPIIRALQTSFLGDAVSQISGIMNGTTNFMLSKMEKEGVSYDAVLKEAQDLGYAEADPTADVGGFDARAKLAILTKLSFGISVNEDDIPCIGIQNVSKDDFEYAALLNSTIKLLGVSRRLDDKSITTFVSPCVVSGSDNLAKIDGATNAIEVLSSNLASSFFVGQGAGRFPTANSIVNDMLGVMMSTLSPAFPLVPTASSPSQVAGDYEAAFYIRFCIKDCLGIIRKVGEACESAGVSINSILQTTIRDPNNVPFVLKTETCKLSQITTVCANISKQDFCHGDPFYMPFL